MFELFILGLTFICLLIASIEDWKTREVPDYLSYFFMAAALIFRVLDAAYENSFLGLLWIPVSFGLFFGFSYLMYRAGQWGGGDVKLMMGISIALSSFSTDAVFPYFINFFMNLLIVGAIYGVIMIVYLGLKNRKKIKLSSIDKILIILTIALVLAAVYFFRTSTALMFISVMLIVSLGLLKHLKLVETTCMQDYIPIEKITEGDWLVKDVKFGGTVIKPRAIGLTMEDIKKLRKLSLKYKIKNVLIKIGIPFIPAFFFAFLATLLVGNTIFWLLSFAI